LKDRLSRLVPSVNRALEEVEQRENRRSLEDQLRQAHKMESIGTLAGGVAHDFNNLLTVIIGNAQLALAKVKPGDPTYDSLIESEKVGRRAADLTGQLLVFSRRQKLDPRIVNLNDSLPDFMKMLERIIGANIEVQFESPSNLPLLTADPAQIEQAVMNLAVNARDAMPSGGRITIKAREVTLDEDYCQQDPLAKPGRYVRIDVSDSGTGIDDVTRKRIFEPFFTTKEPGKGTGLGLSVVYGVIKQHNGFIEVDSVLGRGTTFALFVPVVEPGDSELVRESLDSELRGGAETILVAEDEESLRTLVQQVLGGLGYRVMLARDGREAVEIFAQHRDQIDLVTLDMVMPRLSGREAYEQIRKFQRDVPVIFVTGYAGETAGPPFLEETGAELLHKPYSVDMLGRKIRKVLDLGRRSSPATSG
jgi:two-component system cell cycle sensor histidine kinase/response regulator CckA